MSYLSKLSSPPKKTKRDTHYWADYVELLCIVNKDNVCSQKDFIDRIKQQRDVEDSEVYDKEETNLDYNEANSTLAEDTFILLEYRISSFNEYYPFIISDDRKTLHFQHNAINDKHKLYLFLLMSSCLNYFTQYKTQLTSSFERLSLAVTKEILPSNANAVIFGSSNTEDINTEDQEAQSLLWNKINSLASNLKERVLIAESELSKYNKGDGGLDIYGWINLGDNNRHFPLYFCQCACTHEWTKKQNSSKFDRWNNFITLSVYPHNIIFIPFSFRSANGEWHDEHNIEKSILIDRDRVIKILKNKEAIITEFESYSIVNSFATTKESVV